MGLAWTFHHYQGKQGIWLSSLGELQLELQKGHIFGVAQHTAKKRSCCRAWAFGALAKAPGLQSSTSRPNLGLPFDQPGPARKIPASAQERTATGDDLMPICSSDLECLPLNYWDSGLI